MSQAQVLVATRKGAFILTSDGKRERWDIGGPYLRAGKCITSKALPRTR